ncbi:hypothetical protein LGL08_19820 [Clostridium estertheticum]|uniref:hypothetical protein n=1 Tax=Clostridium estertheticum TaxID=238834 RepID=UPI001CF2E766|nr:hypothetical protein [Clostridium estertheticum]MCB2308790.1 hypothetical protein [Clostridium estertheticum]MCB2347132.1 hypothetical protein [Clostridium estertheticum]MCB2351776.1 hypothetical protein [Clostridium estertheticum]WAG44502.1 hypothetical protein LL127_13120 [Clostridium estertheticum]
MKKLLLKVLSVIVFISMILPSSSTAFAAQLSNPPVYTNITITNNAGAPDILNVTGLAKGDIVIVYSSATGKKSIGTGTAKVAGVATVSIKQIGSLTGNVYVSVKSTGLLESNKIKKAYDAEVKSIPLDPRGIVVKNNAVGTKDTVVVPGLAIGDIIKVYSGSTDGVLLGTATAKTDGDLTVSIDQIGAEAGNVYVSVTSKTLLESDTTAAVAYPAEVKSIPLDIAGIVVTNNAAGTKDTVVVPGLAIGDIIKVYSGSTDGVLLGTATAKADGDLTVSIDQVGSESGNVYVTVTSKTLLESDRTKAIAYAAEAKSTPLDQPQIVVTNNAVGTPDTVVVQNLYIGDIVKVYSAAIGGVLIGTSTATASGLTVSIPQIGAAGGTLYVSVIRKTFLESNKTAVTYAAEAKSIPLYPSNITVTNNAAGTADTVVVKNLAIGDVVKVYSSATAGLVIGTATVTVEGDLTVSITQLGAKGGSIYVSVTSEKLLESDRTKEITYASEAKSIPLDPSNIVVINNSNGISSRVLIQNLAIGDIVKIYSIAKGGPAIGKGTVITTKTDTVRVDLFVNITQTKAGIGDIYVSVTRKKLLESDRTLAKRYF